MKKKHVALITALMSSIAMTVQAQAIRDTITIAAGYAPYPMAVAMAEQFTQADKTRKTPNIQSTSPELAYKQFCAGDGPDTLDATVVLRPMTPAEEELCAKNDVKDFAKFKAGLTAIVLGFLGNPKDYPHLTRKELFLAMAKDIPDPQGGNKLIPNHYKTWKEINPAFPDTKIQIWNSTPVFAYYPVVLKQIMTVGCKQMPSLQALESTDPKAFEAACTTFRKDGHYNEYDSLDTVRAKLGDGIGIFSDAFANKFALNKLAIDDADPLPGSISHNVYPLISPLIIQVKKSHFKTVTGLKEYMTEALSDKAISHKGYLLEQGLVPLPVPELQKMRAELEALH